MSYHIEKKTNSIVIDGFEQGIADDPYSGISDMRNAEIISVPKEASVAMATESMQTQAPITNATFTVNAVTPATVRSTANAGWGTGTSTVITKPSGLIVGDIMIAHLYVATGYVSVTPPSGFAIIGSTAEPTGRGTVFYYYKIADSGDVAATNFTFSWSGSVENFGSLIAVQDGDTTFANWKWGGDNKTASNTDNPSINATVTPTTASLLLQMWTEFENITAISGYAIATSNPSWTESYDVDSGSGERASFAYGYRTQTTATGNVSCVGGTAGNTEWCLGFLAIPSLAASGSTFTYNGVIPLEVNTVITVSNSGGSLPSGLSANTAYYVKTVDSSTTFTVSSVCAGGATLSLTTTGSGTNTFSTIQMGTPKYFTSYLWPFFSSFTYFYFLQDSNGRIWVLDNQNLGDTNKWVYMHSRSSEASTNTANGLIAYRNYLFTFTSTDINVINIVDVFPNSPSLAHLTTIASWNFGWNQLLTSAQSDISHQAIISQNDSSVYICNGNNIATIYLIPGSLPADVDGNEFNIANTHTIATGATTSGSTSITTVGAFFEATDVGAVIVGTGIPTGTIISSVTSSTAAVLSANATATASGLTFTITSAYSFNAEILPLPPNEQATCLTELGDNLIVGGINNYLYPWDRVSPNFSQPIFLAEAYAYQMVTVNTNTYIFTGERGRIYVTNGSQAQLWKKIPDHISGVVNPFFVWKGAIFNRNQLYFGFSVTDNTGSTINQYGGVWAIDIDTKAIRLVNELSYGTFSGYASAFCVNKGVSINSVQTNMGYGLFTGWSDGSVGGVDVGVSTPYTAVPTIIVSDLIPIGTFDKPTDFERVEYKLSRPMVAGESISIYARLIFNTEDTGFGSAILSDSTAGNFSKSEPVNFKNAQWIQLKAIYYSTETTPSYTRLTQLRISGNSI